MKITMTQVKVAMTALAGTVAALSAAQATGTIDIIPAKVMHWMTNGAVVLGIFGASPLGRLLFKDAPSNDIVPKAERGAPGAADAPADPPKAA